MQAHNHRISECQRWLQPGFENDFCEILDQSKLQRAQLQHLGNCLEQKVTTLRQHSIGSETSVTLLLKYITVPSTSQGHNPSMSV